MKPGLYDDLVTENLIREIENLKADGIVPLFGNMTEGRAFYLALDRCETHWLAVHGKGF